MPIYAYRCGTCGHAKDVLQKVSDPLLTTCPACGAESFSKQLTAAGFQLKGSGWYVTDFRGENAKKPPQAVGEAPKGDQADKPGKSDGTDSAAGKPSDAAATPAAASPPAPAPAPTAGAAATPVSTKTGSPPSKS